MRKLKQTNKPTSFAWSSWLSYVKEIPSVTQRAWSVEENLATEKSLLWTHKCNILEGPRQDRNLYIDKKQL